MPKHNEQAKLKTGIQPNSLICLYFNLFTYNYSSSAFL